MLTSSVVPVVTSFGAVILLDGGYPLEHLSSVFAGQGLRLKADRDGLRIVPAPQRGAPPK